MKETYITFLLLILGGTIGLCALVWLWMRYQDNQELKWYTRSQMLERGIYPKPGILKEIEKARDAAIELMKHFEK